MVERWSYWHRKSDGRGGKGYHRIRIDLNRVREKWLWKDAWAYKRTQRESKVCPRKGILIRSTRVRGGGRETLVEREQRKGRRVEEGWEGMTRRKRNLKRCVGEESTEWGALKKILEEVRREKENTWKGGAVIKSKEDESRGKESIASYIEEE